MEKCKRRCVSFCWWNDDENSRRVQNDQTIISAKLYEVKGKATNLRIKLEKKDLVNEKQQKITSLSKEAKDTKVLLTTIKKS